MVNLRSPRFLVLYAFQFLVLVQIQVSCYQYKVGDLDAWGIPTSANPQVYTYWSKYHTLKIGDSLLFLYPPSQDSVIQVTRENYNSCNLTDPILYMNNGNSLFNITAYGDFYFTSGVQGHCQKKQKLHISVPGNGSASAYSPRKLSWFARANISGGAAIFFGFWRFGKSLDSGVDHILAMDGSRMQKELANIMVNKYRDDPWTMQHLNRRFYSEKVFDDSNLHRPIISLQYRNSFGDNVAYGQRTHDSNSHDDSHSDSDIKRDDVESKKLPMNLGAKVMEDPLESIFGFVAPVEEIHHLDTSGKPARVLNRSHKRSHRRHRMRHQEASLNSERLQPQQI